MKAALITGEQICELQTRLDCLHAAVTDGFALSIDDVNEARAIVAALNVKDVTAEARPGWVDLTYDEYPDYEVGNRDFFRGARWAYMRLKEKNK